MYSPRYTFDVRPDARPPVRSLRTMTAEELGRSSLSLRTAADALDGTSLAHHAERFRGGAARAEAELVRRLIERGRRMESERLAYLGEDHLQRNHVVGGGVHV